MRAGCSGNGSHLARWAEENVPHISPPHDRAHRRKDFPEADVQERGSGCRRVEEGHLQSSGNVLAGRPEAALRNEPSHWCVRNCVCDVDIPVFSY